VNSAWVRLYDAIKERRRRNREKVEQAVRAPGRLDFALSIAVLTFVGGLAAAGGGIALGQAIFGWFDDPPVAPVQDRRMLTSFREFEKAGPFTDMAVSHDSGELFVLRRGGTIHRLNLKTGLWSEEILNDQVKAVTGDMIALRAGCGGNLGNPACNYSGKVWALSAEGGIAVREDGAWNLLIGDEPWIGLNGKPVEHSALTALAVSEGGRWILLGTHTQGVGLFDTQANSWIQVNTDEQRSILSTSADDASVAAVTHVLWSHSQFWIAGAAGLARIDPASTKPALLGDASADGIVLDLDQTLDGNLLALVEGSCKTSGDSCLSVRRIRGPDRYDIVIGETERNPDLSERTARYAAARGDAILVLGEAGAHRYDPAARNWVEILSGPVTAYFEPARSKALYMAIPGTVVRLDGLAVAQRWEIDDERIESLIPSEGGGILAIDRNLTVHSLLPGGGTAVLRRAPSSPLDPSRFLLAASTDRVMVLGGPDGVLLQDVVTRRYNTLRLNRLPRHLSPILADCIRLVEALSGRWKRTRLFPGSVFPAVDKWVLRPQRRKSQRWKRQSVTLWTNKSVPFNLTPLAPLQSSMKPAQSD